MAEYILKSRKQGQYFPEITVNFDTPQTGATICANFVKGGRALPMFSPVFTVAGDGLSATNAGENLKLDFPADTYYTDFTLIDANGKETPLCRYYITITDSTC